MAYFDCIVGGVNGDGVALIVQCDANFAGSVITATNGTDTFTETCPSVSPYTVRFEGIPTGTYTISGVSQGQTFTTQFTVLDYETTLNATPDGATVLPINDIQIWLHCANIWDKTYTTLDEVLADNTTLLALISDHNAVDYMVRSTDFIGQGYNLVPIMTSNTTPSGVASASQIYAAGYDAYKAFDGNESTNWQPAADTVASPNSWLCYKFTEKIKCVKAKFLHLSNNRITSYKIQGSNDNTSWVDLTETIQTTYVADKVEETALFSKNIDKYQYYRLYVVTSTYTPMVHELQFWGAPGVVDNQTAMGYIGNNDYCADTLLADATWCEAIGNSDYFESVLNVKVPTMTSNTTPSGVASATSVMSGYSAYLAFDNNDSTYWLGNGYPQTLYYEFPSAIKVYKFSYKGYAVDNLAKDIAIVNGNSGDAIIQSYTTVNQDAIQSFIINSPSKIQKWGLKCINTQGGSNAVAKTLQFYGRA